MPPGPQVIRQTAAEFARMVRDFSERLSSDAGFAELMAAACGGPERVQAFTRPSGVGISAFAALLGVPASTVRHYQRLGLITPYAVNGKFRFWVHNLIQLESVRQWRDLGLSLDDIRAQRSLERLGGQSLTFNALTTGGLSALVTEKALRIEVPGLLGTSLLGSAPLNSLAAGSVWFPLQEERRPVAPRDLLGSDGPETPPDTARLLDEIRAARRRLEQQRQRLTARIEQARRLEQALER